MQRILNDLKWHPSKVQVVQELSEEDFASRFDFATDVLQRIGEDQQCLHSLAFSDEAHFHHDGTVNRHYYRYCRSPENLFELFFV